MILAFVLMAVLFVGTCWFLRPRKIIKLKKLPSSLNQGVFQKINREIRIFNKMRIIMPARKGVPLLYLKWLGQLHVEPRAKTQSIDGFERLMYLCAAANLYARTHDEHKRRQLYKNCLYVLGGARCMR